MIPPTPTGAPPTPTASAPTPTGAPPTPTASAPTPTSARSPTHAPPTPTPAGRSAVVPPEIARGNTARRQIALTFDAGASAAPLPKILATLRQSGIRSTFFLTGAWASANPLGVEAIVADGHELGNHSFDHPDCTTLGEDGIIEQLRMTEETVQKIAGRTTKPFFRPPFGARDRRVLAAAWSAGYRSVYWTIDSGDWRENATVDGVIDTVLTKAVNGAIVVMHVGSSQTADGLARLISGLKAQGFEIVPLSAVFSNSNYGISWSP
jgi:peptidoglycan/xylan/chitin deacetylase (PgdA/CDA1 family)